MKKKDNLFKPGQSGNSKGRPPLARGQVELAQCHEVPGAHIFYFEGKGYPKSHPAFMR